MAKHGNPYSSSHITANPYVRQDVAIDVVAYCIARSYALPGDAISCGNMSLYLARCSFVLSLLSLRDRIYGADEDAIDAAIGLGRWLRSSNMR